MQTLTNTVISNDYCIGCGACSFVDTNYSVKMDQFGMFKASAADTVAEMDTLALKVCPFSNGSKNEDEISNEIYRDASHHHEYLGKYINNYVGYVSEGDFRQKGSSGGFGKWILNELLVLDKVDYVLQVVGENKTGTLFTYQVYKKGDDILTGSKSAYYPVTLTEGLDFIRSNEGRYAITAIPCFSKAIRNICLHDSKINKRVKFIIGIVCGHLKSTAFAESLGWQLDVHPDQLSSIEFRGKIEGLKANDKGVFAIDSTGVKSKTESSKKLFGGRWEYGFFKYKACDYCDDIVGETTDVSIGDAWLETLMDDHQGNNVLVVRNREIAEIIENAMTSNRLFFSEVDASVVVATQLGGIRHRREGLTYRLFNKVRQNKWVPVKRVTPGNNIPPHRKRLYRVREEMSKASHDSFLRSKESGNFQNFIDSMMPFIDKLERPPLMMKVILKIKQIFYELKTSQR